MPRQIIIRFEPDNVHRMRNFDEDLWRAFQSIGYGEISLAEVDRALVELRVRKIPARWVRRQTALISELLEKHHLVSIAQLATLDDPS